MDLNRTSPFRKLLTITVPAIALTAVVLAGAVEAWARATRAPNQGTPGLFEPDPVRRIRLAPDYDGWFAGVPVHTNRLGLRDDRDGALEKRPNTFRILVLGDSVTFGHGSVAANAYPQLLERLLREWRPAVDWQVWNAGVPGYNTSQELAHLLELGPIAKPDLVVVGFFENDVEDNFDLSPPTRFQRAASALRAVVQKHFYSFELYRRVLLTLEWKLSASDAYRKRLEALESEDKMFTRLPDVADSRLQQLSPYDRLTDAQRAERICPKGETADPTMLPSLQANPGYGPWLRAVRALQRLNADGVYRIVFFLNVIPRVCPSEDAYYDGGVGVENAFFLNVMGDGTPAVSVFDAFLHRVPSQMPYAQAHAIGNANLTKAETLLEFLKARRLVPAR